MPGAPRIPSRVVFPFGYRITVKLVSRREIKELDFERCENCGHEINGGVDHDGLYDDQTRTVYVVRTLTPKRKRYILLHELDHAWNDYKHAMLDEGVAKN